MIGWLLDTNVTAEIISIGGSAVVKGWAAAQVERTLHLSILTIAAYDKSIANLADGDARRAGHMTTRDRLGTRSTRRLLPVSNAIVRRWGIISGPVRRDIGHPPPGIDTLLAATAFEHALYFVTRHVRVSMWSATALTNVFYFFFAKKKALGLLTPPTRDAPKAARGWPPPPRPR